ncbi:MAG: 5'-3' exonuclease H3TH domain-containing protein [Patescibacteria group bacterium]
MKKLILIDGNAILHRAFHALPPLTGKNGEIVNAVYGFFSMFLKILEDLKPQYIIVCFDKKAPTFRQSLYVGYQAKRPKMADELVPQIAKVHEVLKKAKVSIFEIDGYEADDLIGTLANQTQNLDVIIVSGDRDMLQLVNSHVKVLAPITGITKMILFDEKMVEEKYSIKPTQIIDYKALVGDASDNYKGVKGIGPKTAASLLKEHGTFESMYKNINSLPLKISEKLATDAEQAALAKKLATIITDAPITLRLENCSRTNLGVKNLKEEFEKLGFKSLLKRLQSTPTEERKKSAESQQLGLL